MFDLGKSFVKWGICLMAMSAVKDLVVSVADSIEFV